MYKVVKEYWTGTRMTQARGLTYDDAMHKSLSCAKTRSCVLPQSEISQGTNGYKVSFKLDGRMVPDTYFIVEPDDEII